MQRYKVQLKKRSLTEAPDRDEKRQTRKCKKLVKLIFYHDTFYEDKISIIKKYLILLTRYICIINF